MLVIPGAMQAVLNASSMPLALCFQLTKKDGSATVGFTDFDQPLAFDAGDGKGTVVYDNKGGFKSSAVRSAEGRLRAASVFVEAFFSAGGVTRNDLLAGRWRSASFRVYVVDWSDPVVGKFYSWIAGRLGKTQIRDDDFRVELKSLASLYEQKFLRVYQPGCNISLGRKTHPICGVPIEPDEWAAATAYAVGDYVKATAFDNRIYRCTTAGVSDAAEPVWDTGLGNTTADNTVVWTTEVSWEKRTTVTAVTDRRVFTLDGPSPRGTSAFDFGTIKFLDGPNADIYMDIVNYDTGTDQAILFAGMPFDVSVAENVAIFPGCNKSTSVNGGCKAFDNILNFRGFDQIPGRDVILQIPE